MASLLDSIRDGLELVVDKTEEYSKIGKIKVDIFTIKRNIEKQLTELGGRTYDILTAKGDKEVADDDAVKKFVADIQSLEQQLRDKEANIDKVKVEKEKERQERQETRKKQAKVNVTDDSSFDASEAEDATVIDESDK